VLEILFEIDVVDTFGKEQ